MSHVTKVRMFSQDEIRAKYETLARWYDLEDLPYELLCVRRLRRGLISQATGDTLEIAVGTGKNLPYYQPNVSITAIDYSEPMMDQARKRAERLGKSVNFKIMDAAKLAFLDERFDTVVSTLSGCTFPDPEGVYREMARVCRKDGNILLIEHGRSDVHLLAWLQDKLALSYYNKYACLWNRDPLPSLTSAGIEVIESWQALFGVFRAMQVKRMRSKAVKM